MQESYRAPADHKPAGKGRRGQLAVGRRRDIDRIKERAVRLPVLALRVRRLDDEIDQGAGHGDLLGWDHTARDELLRLADDHTAGIAGGLRDRQRVQGNGFVVQGTIAILIDAAGPKNPNVDLEAAIEHEVLAVDALDRHVVRRTVPCRLVHFPGFDPWIDERSQANATEISWTPGGDGAIKT